MVLVKHVAFRNLERAGVHAQIRKMNKHTFVTATCGKKDENFGEFAPAVLTARKRHFRSGERKDW